MENDYKKKNTSLERKVYLYKKKKCFKIKVIEITVKSIWDRNLIQFEPKNFQREKYSQKAIFIYTSD